MPWMWQTWPSLSLVPSSSEKGDVERLESVAIATTRSASSEEAGLRSGLRGLSVVPDDSISRVAAYEEEPGIGALVSSAQSGTSVEIIPKTPPVPPVPRHRSETVTL